MTTKQSNTTALTDEQLKGVAGGFVKYVMVSREPKFGGGNKYHDKGSYVSISPVPTPIPKVLFPRGRARIIWPEF